MSGSRLAAAAGAGFALSTLGGYLLSVWIGLFGFKEVRTTAGIVAGVIEVAAFAVLAVFAATPPASRAAGHRPARGPLLDRLQDGIPGAAWGVAGLSVVALVLLGVAVAGAGAPATASAGGGLKAVQIGGASVLANARGFTLYSFAPDTADQVGLQRLLRRVLAAGERPGDRRSRASRARLGTIKRSDGSTQATYDGHPLYTYVGDSAPGQAHGNDAQPQRRAVARGPHGRLSPDQESVSCRRPHRSRSRPPGRAWPPRTGRGR